MASRRRQGVLGHHRPRDVHGHHRPQHRDRHDHRRDGPLRQQPPGPTPDTISSVVVSVHHGLADKPRHRHRPRTDPLLSQTSPPGPVGGRFVGRVDQGSNPSRSPRSPASARGLRGAGWRSGFVARWTAWVSCRSATAWCLRGRCAVGVGAGVVPALFSQVVMTCRRAEPARTGGRGEGGSVLMSLQGRRLHVPGCGAAGCGAAGCGAASCGAGAAPDRSWRRTRMVAIAMSRASSPIPAATSNAREKPTVRA